MKWAFFRVIQLGATLAIAWGSLVLSGCSRPEEIEPTRVPSTTAPSQTPVLIPPTLTITVPTEDAYPPPITEAVVIPTQEMAAYPAPLEVTQPALSSTPAPTVTPSENLLAVPYPLLETPLPQQINGSSPSPYPPPVEVPTQVSNTSVASNPIPTGIGSATPIPQNTASPSGTPILTPQATRVKTRFVATDPRTVNLEAGRPQMVVFFTKWCTLCKSVAPVILNLESQYSDRVNFIYLDADDAGTKTLQKKFSYRLIARPRIFLIDGTGVILRDWTGYVAIEELQQALNSVVPAAIAPATIAPVSP